MAAPKKPAEPAAPAPEKPRILAFFERVGLVKGERYQTVVMTAAAGRSYSDPQRPGHAIRLVGLHAPRPGRGLAALDGRSGNLFR